jgi:HTH-type transcriptional regulator/antitoxin HigA
MSGDKLMVSISQEWIDKVSREEDEFSAVGPHVISISDIDTKTLFTNFSSSSAAMEILRRRWFDSIDNAKTAKADLAERVQDCLLRNKPVIANAPMFRTSKSVRNDDVNRQIATYIWLFYSETIAQTLQLGEFKREKLCSESIEDLVQLSSRDDGPKQAKQWLKNAGVACVVNSSLPSMRLDGSCSFLASETPMIALTIRYDRVDNFWFTLMHEIGHLKLHFEADHNHVFLDDLDNIPEDNEKEAEANSFARDSLIPRDKWRRSEAFRLKTKNAVLKLAEERKIHPAIVAGRLRHETGDYTLHSELLGQDTVRDQLIEVGV